MITSTWAQLALEHARYLSERIGPRGASTPEEKRAAEYARDQLQRSGLREVELQAFPAPRSGWLPLTIMFSLAVWGTIICWGGFYLTHVPAIGATIGALLCAMSAWTIYRIATQHSHPLQRWLATATSYNAVGRIAATQQATEQVVLVANLDIYPDSWVFRTPRRTRLLYGLLRLAAGSLIASIVLFVLGGLQAWSFAFVTAGVCGLVQSLGILLTIQADQGEYSPGANDNASGVGTVLALAQQLQQTPLKQTEVWIVCAGSHTLDNGGLRTFLQRSATITPKAWFIGCQRVGYGDRVTYVAREGWLPRSVRGEVRDLIGRTPTDRVGQQPQAVSTLRNTPISPALWRGYKGLCVGVKHQTEAKTGADTTSRLQLAALHQTQQLIWSLLETIDH